MKKNLVQNFQPKKMKMKKIERGKEMDGWMMKIIILHRKNLLFFQKFFLNGSRFFFCSFVCLFLFCFLFADLNNENKMKKNDNVKIVNKQFSDRLFGNETLRRKKRKRKKSLITKQNRQVTQVNNDRLDKNN